MMAGDRKVIGRSVRVALEIEGKHPAPGDICRQVVLQPAGKNARPAPDTATEIE
jgi:hypothetical protein